MPAATHRIVDAGIVMLAHNGAEFTRRALDGILSAQTLPAEFFLVDNCSEDDTPALIREFAPRFQAEGIRFTTWRNAENMGCSRARNEAWEKVSAPFTVLLDNDTAVCTQDWLTRLAARFTEDTKLGILAPKMIYPYLPNPIQCAGVAFNKAGRVAFLGRGAPREDLRFGQFRLCRALISACWMMRTELRDSVGLLDELFHPVQYEDLDLCVRAWDAGWKVACDPSVEMYHFEGITTASFGQEAYSVNIARNSLKFRQRYHDRFAEWDENLPEEMFRWKPRTELNLQPILSMPQKER